VGWVIVTTRGLGKWISLRFVAIARTAAGVSLPPCDGATSSFEPFEKNSGAPHSSVSMWEKSVQITL
jgi:hypothetical protein